MTFFDSLSRPALAVALVAAAATACSGPTTPSAADLGRTNLAGRWTLVAQQRAGEAETTPPAGAVFSLELVDGRIAVGADCNRCGGPASIDADTVTLGPALACTRAFCSSAPYDDTFLRIVGGESTATIDGDTLTLRSERGVARFRR